MSIGAASALWSSMRSSLDSTSLMTSLLPASQPVASRRQLALQARAPPVKPSSAQVWAPSSAPSQSSAPSMVPSPQVTLAALLALPRVRSQVCQAPVPSGTRQ